jgi:hypothetical protein
VRSKTPFTVTILGGIVALALTGCNNNPGTPSASTSSTNTTTSSAPTIANPLDTSKLQQNLCAGLTQAQLDPYMGKVDSTKVDNKSSSTSCLLFPADLSGTNISVTVYPKQTVSEMIASGANFPYSKNLAPIQGYPAQSSSQENPPHGECGTSVAVSDHVVVEVSARNATQSYQYYNNMCAVTEALAPMLVSNIKAG